MPAGSLYAEPLAKLPHKQAHHAPAEISAEATHRGLISRHEVQMLGLNSTVEKAGSQKMTMPLGDTQSHLNCNRANSPGTCRRPAQEHP